MQVIKSQFITQLCFHLKKTMLFRHPVCIYALIRTQGCTMYLIEKIFFRFKENILPRTIICSSNKTFPNSDNFKHRHQPSPQRDIVYFKGFNEWNDKCMFDRWYCMS